MGQGVGGGAAEEEGKVIHKKLSRSLVVEDVKIIENEIVVNVPRFVDKVIEVPKFVDREVIVTDVKVKTEEKTVQTFTVKVVEKEVTVERPVFKDVEVVRPKFVTKEILEPIVKKVEVVVEVPRVEEKLKIIEKPVEIKTYKLVEEIIRVPKINYVPTEVERIIWKDVPRERCEHCRKEVG